MTIDRIWYILGKKLNKEASNEELEEFSLMLSQHAELHYSLQNIFDLWMLGKQNSTQVAISALQTHLLRQATKQSEIFNISIQITNTS